jgi:hypothetical protein
MQENIFLEPGDETNVQKIREVSYLDLAAAVHPTDDMDQCLDTGDEFPWAPADTKDPHIPLAFGSTLFMLLDSLTDPVIPGILHSKCVEMSNRDEAFEVSMRRSYTVLNAKPSPCDSFWTPSTLQL